jgi:excinuclease ABC subunit A
MSWSRVCSPSIIRRVLVPGCDGLGVKQFFDPDRIVQFPEASISEGAIRGWDRRNFYYFQMLTSLADHYGFDVDTPWEKLKKAQRNILLYGSDDEDIVFHLFQ